jgi:hypothetical protein
MNAHQEGAAMTRPLVAGVRLLVLLVLFAAPRARAEGELGCKPGASCAGGPAGDAGPPAAPPDQPGEQSLLRATFGIGVSRLYYTGYSGESHSTALELEFAFELGNNFGAVEAFANVNGELLDATGFILKGGHFFSAGPVAPFVAGGIGTIHLTLSTPYDEGTQVSSGQGMVTLEAGVTFSRRRSALGRMSLIARLMVPFASFSAHPDYIAYGGETYHAVFGQLVFRLGI